MRYPREMYLCVQSQKIRILGNHDSSRIGREGEMLAVCGTGQSYGRSGRHVDVTTP